MTMTSKVPFNVNDFLLTDPQDFDFNELEDDHLVELITEYGSTNPLLASFALIELVARARRNEPLKALTVPVLAKIVQDNKVDGDFFATALTSLYRLDRVQGQAEIARVIDTSNDSAVSGAADVLAYDIELYKGDPVFDEAVRKVAERLRKDCQNDHVLADDELYFLRKAGYPVVPSSDLDEHDRDIGAFRAYATTGDFVGSIVERNSNQAEVVRVQPLIEDVSSLLVLYEIVELGMNHTRARQLIYQHVLVELYDDKFRGKVQDVIYQDILQETAEHRPYGAP